jgi:hypothetical protein
MMQSATVAATNSDLDQFNCGFELLWRVDPLSPLVLSRAA